MRVAFVFVVTVIVAGQLAGADRAFAQEPGKLRITMQLTNPRGVTTYPAARKTLTITAVAGAPVHRVETRSDGMVEISLPPGVYLVESTDPVRFFDRFYTWRTRTVVAPGVTVVVELTERNGQSTPMPSAARGPFVAPFAQYGAPLRWAGGAAVLVSIGRTTRDSGILGARGLELQASAGQGGWRVAAGPAAAALPFWWADVLVTATHTTAHPRGAVADATYIGVEAGFALILPLDAWVNLPVVVMFKPSIGFARQLDAPADGKRTMFTWSTGAHLLEFNF